MASEAPRTTFSPGDLAKAADPYELLSEIRRLGPVVRGPGSWLVLGHDEALALLRSSACRSGFVSEIYRSLLPEGAARDEMAHRINFLDPPDHTRVRSLVGKAFTPRRVERLRPYLAELAVTLIGAVAGRERFDLIADYAAELPALVISELLGVPAADRDRLTALSHRVSALLGLGGLDDQQKAAAVEAAEEMHAYLKDLLDRRRKEPHDDLLSALLAAEDAGQHLSEPELLSLAATLYSAGHRTTRDLFCNGMAALLTRGAWWQRVCSHALPTAAIVEEFLRFETPTHFVARMLVRPVEVGEIEIPAGEPIAVVLAAANRDPQAYDRAGEFLPTRWLDDPAPPPPLSFAFGPHFCIGASLARMETSVMVDELARAVPSLGLAVPAAELPWRHSGLFRSLAELPVSARASR